MEETVLIISRDATRTGAPLLLLNNLKWIKKNSSLKFIVILRKGGPLLDDYKSLAEVFLWEDIVTLGTKSNKFKYFIYKVCRKMFRLGDETIARLYFTRLSRKKNIKLIYSNTATNGYFIKQLKTILPCKVLTHVHEGEKMLDFFNANGDVTYNLQVSDQIIAVSNTVKNVLVEKYKIKNNIEVIHGAIDSSLAYQKNNRSLLSKVKDDSIIIMTCGYIGWHKGVDFFIQIARMLSSYKKRRLHFVWIGAHPEDQSYIQLKFDVDRLGLSENITILDSKENILDYFSLADIFLMLSRDESFSLVTIEAGLVCKPVLCFEGSGGPCEIVNHDARFIIPYADINKLCERILALIENGDERHEMGKFLYEKVINNFTIEGNANHLLQVIIRQMN